MGIMGIEAVYARKKKAVSLKNNCQKIHKYLLDKYWTNSGTTRTVFVPNSNEVWSGDITYIRMQGGIHVYGSDYRLAQQGYIELQAIKFYGFVTGN